MNFLNHAIQQKKNALKMTPIEEEEYIFRKKTVTR